jgi:hypothetical protein
VIPVARWKQGKGARKRERETYNRRGVAVWRHYATNRNVADSRPDEVNEFFSTDLILAAALGAGFYSASNTNEYQTQQLKYF